MTVRGRCGFSAQDAWIRNASLRDNVLMGQAWDYARYWAVIDACALQPDLDQLIAGDCFALGFSAVLGIAADLESVRHQTL